MTRPRILRSAASLLLLSGLLSFLLPSPTHAERERAKAGRVQAPAVDPAHVAMLGSAVPESRAVALAKLFRVGDATAPPSDRPLLAVLQANAAPGATRYEASNIAIDVATEYYGRFRLENARVLLEPAADGRSLRFELAGAPFGAASRVELKGNIVWAAGPAGGDKLTIEYRLDDAPVEALRAAFPKRFDPSFHGVLDIGGKADGVIAETTTEDAPATPLKGDFRGSIDWTVLGRSAPLSFDGSAALDDRNLRIRDGHLAWQGITLALQGWLDPKPDGKFELMASFQDIDAKKIATEWQVPEAWRPSAILSGHFKLYNKPGEGFLRYEASAPSIDVPGIDGYSIHIEKPRLKGGILEINTDISVSTNHEGLRVGSYELGNMLFGLQWWRQSLRVSTANTTLFGGENDGTLLYKPAEHPALQVTGRVVKAPVGEVLAALLPNLAVDVEGSTALAYVFGQDAERKPRWSVHASLQAGRIGSVDFVARVFELLKGVDPVFTPDEASALPKPRRGTGTRVDRLFFELARNADGFDVGALLLNSGDYAFEGDGRVSKEFDMQLGGVLGIPPVQVARLAQTAPWINALRHGEGPLFVPVLVTGKPSAPAVALGPGYAELVAKAKRGEAVEPPRITQPRHVGEENVARIPGDPANDYQ